MKGSGLTVTLKYVFLSLAIIVFATGSASALISPSRDDKDQTVERTLAADANVTVTFCASAGEITVRGWNKNEVRARSADAQQVELKRVDLSGQQPSAAKKIDVFINDKSDNEARGDCQASSDVELDVPKGATVQVQTRDGNICIIGVDAAYAGSQNGDISIEQVNQRIEAGSIGGMISVKDSHGRVTLTTVGGGIEATNVGTSEVDDTFEAISVSGDIQLQKVSHQRLNAKSVTGNINLVGSLAHNGNYGFNTMSGDVTLALPADASFRLVARLSHTGEIITDFPLTVTTETLSPPAKTKTAGPTSPTPPPSAAPSSAPTPTPAPSPAPKAPTSDKTPTSTTVTIVKVAPAVKVTPPVVAIPYMARRVIGICGSGDASINVSSFSGSVHLQKR